MFDLVLNTCLILFSNIKPGQGKKSLISTFVCFLTTLAKV